MDKAAVTNSQIARAFSPGMLGALAQPDTTATSARLRTLLMSMSDDTDRASRTLASVFDEAHARLAKNYRSEYFFKNQIVSKVIFGRHSPRTASALLELPAGGSIADVVILNGTSTAYEIKTDLDSFSRLASQVADFATCFQQVYVVTSAARMPLAKRLVPEFVGVIGMQRNGSLSIGQVAANDYSRLDRNAMFEVLRRREALSLLREAIGYEVDVPPADLWSRCKDLFSALPIEAAHHGFVTQLRARGLNGGSLAQMPSLPTSLRAMAYSKELSTAGRNRAIARLRQSVAQTGGI